MSRADDHSKDCPRAREWLGSDPKRLERVRRSLREWGRRHYREYPWRGERNPWLTLAAEILLQRTRASQVEPVFRELRERYSTPDRLVEAGPEAAQEITSHLGIHWRGPLLYSVAAEVRNRGGSPPESPDVLRELPGVGPYTSAAWLSLHRGKRAVIVDSNVGRWLSRMTGCPRPGDPRYVPWVRELADALTPKRGFREYNYAVLDFTISICTPRRPRCRECPLQPDCEYWPRDLSPDAGRHSQHDPDRRQAHPNST